MPEEEVPVPELHSSNTTVGRAANK
jgi:hypothetical protein